VASITWLSLVFWATQQGSDNLWGTEAGQEQNRSRSENNANAVLFNPRNEAVVWWCTMDVRYKATRFKYRKHCFHWFNSFLTAKLKKDTILRALLMVMLIRCFLTILIYNMGKLTLKIFNYFGNAALGLFCVGFTGTDDDIVQMGVKNSLSRYLMIDKYAVINSVSLASMTSTSG